MKRGWRRLVRFVESGAEEYGIRFDDRTASRRRCENLVGTSPGELQLDLLEAVELESR